MRTLKTSLTLFSVICLGVFLGCAIELAAQIPSAQITETSHSNAGQQQEQVVSLTTLQPNQSLVDLVRNAPGVVLIDFYATWCGPCAEQGQVLQNLAPFAAEQNASIIKIDVDQHRDLASVFEVSTLQTIIVINEGKIVERQTGLADQNRVVELFRNQLR